jgi:hypothetical protein
MSMGIYTSAGRRFASKKELKLAKGEPVNFEETSFFGAEYKGAGTYSVVGPAPTKRVWFASVTVDEDGFITKVT